MEEYRSRFLNHLLLQSNLQDNDRTYFSSSIYYRSVEGKLSDTFEGLKDQWIHRQIGTSVEIIEENDQRIFYKMMLNHDQVLFGKIVYQGDQIQYLYEAVESKDKKRYFCHIAYDGTMFEGYQKQLNKRTVQGEFEKALKQVFDEDITVYASGRTDKGVHALNQTLHFDVNTVIPEERLGMVIRSYLPEDIDLKTIEEKPRIFHSRYDVLSKTYMYHIDYGLYDVTKRNYRWYITSFDVNRFKKELQSLIGTHDFQSFTTTTNKNTVRTILHFQYEETDDEMKIYITGDGFLRYMVRNIIMAAYLIANKQLTLSMEELLRSEDNTILKQKANASGLYLYQVTYE